MTTPADVLENFWIVWGHFLTDLIPLWIFLLFLLLLKILQALKDYQWEISPEGRRHAALLKSLAPDPSTEPELSALKSTLRRSRRDSLKGSPDVGDTPYLK